jgi:hypothetical protein
MTSGGLPHGLLWGHYRARQRTLPPAHFCFLRKLTSGPNEKLVANGMDRPCSRPRRHAECAGDPRPWRIGHPIAGANNLLPALDFCVLKNFLGVFAGTAPPPRAFCGRRNKTIPQCAV